MQELTARVTGPGQVHSIKCDVSKEEEVQSMMAFVESKFGHLDVLINNAGVGGSAALNAGPTSEWQTMLQV